MDIDVVELLHIEAAYISREGGSFAEVPEEETGDNNQLRKYTYLTNDQRKQLVFEMLSKSNDGLTLRRGMMKEIREKYEISRWFISRMWKEACRQKNNGEIIVVDTKKSLCGRKLKHDSDETIKRVPLKQRTIMRSFAKALDVSVSTIHRLKQRGIIRSHSNSIKHTLNDRHQTERMKFIMRFFIPTTIIQMPKFELLYNMIHIDEKWFFMTRTTQRFYLCSEEEDPYRTCQTKGFITKVMFLGALARLWIDNARDVLWDGKIGIFPFTEEIAAQRGSINRPKDTIETKPVQHINKDTIRSMILETLLSRIRQNWPTGGCKQIWIQQDNARPHIQPNDLAFIETSTVDGLDMWIIQQPAQSPNLNILDLEFFRAIQSIQHQTFPDSVPKLILSVKEVYDAYDPKHINYTWLSLMHVMAEVLKCKGGNNYKLTHVTKNRQANGSGLREFVEVDQELLNEINSELG